MFIDLIKKRQSCRVYLDKKVKNESIVRCLEAARLAPSACNSQPWHFIVIDDEALKNKFSDAVFNGPYAMNAFAGQAPLLIAVVTEKSSFLARIGGYFRGTQYCLLDIGIAVEHFILQATEEGLSTCWIGWFNEREAKKILHLPADAKIDCLVSCGYSQEALREKKRKTINEVVSYNRYGGSKK